MKKKYPRVMLVGDLVKDVTTHLIPKSISEDAPVLACELYPKACEETYGGANNVWTHLCGKRPFIAISDLAGIDLVHILPLSIAQIEKRHRFIDYKTGAHLLRIDTHAADITKEQFTSSFSDIIKPLASHPHIIIFSNYSDTFWMKEVYRQMVEVGKHQNHILLFDLKYPANFLEDLVCNREWLYVWFANREEYDNELAENLLNQTLDDEQQHLVVHKLDRDGIKVYSHNGTVAEYKAYKQLTHATGAGDVLLAETANYLSVSPMRDLPVCLKAIKWGHKRVYEEKYI